MQEWEGGGIIIITRRNICEGGVKKVKVCDVGINLLLVSWRYKGHCTLYRRSGDIIATWEGATAATWPGGDGLCGGEEWLKCDVPPKIHIPAVCKTLENGVHRRACAGHQHHFMGRSRCRWPEQGVRMQVHVVRVRQVRE